MSKDTRQDLTAAVTLFAFFLAVLFLGIGCADSPAAPTPAAVAVRTLTILRGATEARRWALGDDRSLIPAGISA